MYKISAQIKIFYFFIYLLIILNITSIISGCSGVAENFGKGIGEGITKKLLENSKKNDARQCRIWSEGFKGIGHSINKQNGKTKVLMVHGVNNHTPGYSTLLLEKLSKQLDLDIFIKPQKNLKLTSSNDNKKDLGNLRLTKLMSRDKKRELLFYELTWSNITKKDKEVLTFDQSGLASFRRTQINNIFKKVTNDALADPLVYLGNKQEDIQSAVTQSYCWMIRTTYNDFPDKSHQRCDLYDKKILQRAKQDDYIFITHSLGSRITIDAMDRIARIINNKTLVKKYPGIADLHDVMQEREITIFMLSNQLQLLQMGRDLPEVIGQEPRYCLKSGSKYNERFANKTNIIALSDPNDVLSYAIPRTYKDRYLDSRLCPEISNININIANLINLFNLGEIANPLEAHTGYDADDRVIALLAYGLGNRDSMGIVNQRCDWVKTI